MKNLLHLTIIIYMPNSPINLPLHSARARHILIKVAGRGSGMTVEYCIHLLPREQLSVQTIIVSSILRTHLITLLLYIEWRSIMKAFSVALLSYVTDTPGSITMPSHPVFSYKDELAPTGALFPSLFS